MAASFDITPEQRASAPAFLKRQLFRTTSPVKKGEVDLAGQNFIVTGLGKLILAVRSLSKGDAAREQLAAGRLAEKDAIEVWKLDLPDYNPVVEFTERTKPLKRLDVVVHNAGSSRKTLQLNPKTGHDEVIQTNYLSRALSMALLKIMMLPILKEKNPLEHPGRLALVSSETAAWAQFKERTSKPILPAFTETEGFDDTDRYWTSKLLGQLFLSELTKRVPSSVAIVKAMNPGMCYGSNLVDEWSGSLVEFIIGRSTSVGARALTDAAVRHDSESHGQYLEDGKPQPLAPLVYTVEGTNIAKQLWEETMDELAFDQVANILTQLNA
ncbi:retinol dehydrogenase 12 [Thozetella sp. PMI_491]|nr:retinol dehydrogenase 12 [Thozetella sp. PMI_491]